MKRLIIISSTALVIMLSPVVNAQNYITTALEKCRTETNALKRLVCYDEIESGTTNSVKAAPRPEINTSQMASTAAVTEAIERPATAASEFGREHKQAINDEVDTINATVSELNYSPRKEMIITFDNGQIWRQAESGSFQVKVGQRYYIKRGTLGAFYLGKEGSNRTLKVRRQE